MNVFELAYHEIKCLCNRHDMGPVYYLPNRSGLMPNDRVRFCRWCDKTEMIKTGAPNPCK